MNPLTHFKQTILQLLVTIVLACFGLLPQLQAVSPPPDGCYPNYTTAEGCSALNFLTTGAGNTGVGWYSLYFNTTGNFNTGVGGGALALNNADSNTAVGAAALLLNITGTKNVAVGTDALVNNDSGSNNSAFGYSALFSHQTGSFNTAFGTFALFANIEGVSNSAFGEGALASNTGINNTAVGDAALVNSTGDHNTALGAVAGSNLTTGNGNVYIGAFMFGVAGESDHTYIRNINATSVSGGLADTVTVDLDTGLLGHLTSSRRHKEDIRAMDGASETLYRLKPVTYRYKKEIDRNQVLDYGLIAEEVAEIDPSLAIRNGKGEIESVRYNAINVMLLNEFLKEHRKNEEQEATIARQQKQIEALIAGLQKVSAQLAAASPSRGGLEANRPAPQVVKNNQ